MAKVNKDRTTDVFSGLKYVDKLMNEAAGVGNPPKKLSFEDKMKQKLKEGYGEATESTEENLDEYEYNHPYTNNAAGAGSTYLGEAEPEDEFANEFDFEDEEEFDFDNDVQASRAASKDMEAEFVSDEDEFDFTEDADLMESLLEAEPAIDMPDDQTTDEVPAVAAGEEPAPIDATPTDDMGIEGEVEGMDDLGMEDPEMGMEPEMGDIGSSAPSMGGEMSGMEPTGEEPASMSPVDGPEDIDQLIADLVSGTGAEEQPAVFGENAHKDLGFKDLGDEDINSKKVKMESKKGVNPFAKKAEEEEAKEKKAEKKEVKEGEIKLTKLGDADITGNVKGATAGKAVSHSGLGKRNDPKGEEYTDLGDEDITSGKVSKAAEKAEAPTQPKFASLKKENEEKTKALFTLAEQVITLQDEVTNLKFAKFKLEKVNSVLALLPELKLATREKLVEKFDACKSYAETKKLYTEVAEMVKDHKRGSLNEAVAKTQKSSTRYFTEDSSDDSSTIDEATARRNMLMGLPGYDDAYGA